MIDKVSFHNTHDVLHDEQGALPVRFTNKQFHIYEETEGFYVRSKCPAGVKLECITDSSFLHISYYIEGWCRESLYFDLYVNDQFIETAGMDQLKVGTEEVQFNLDKSTAPGSSKKVTVYLPHMAVIRLKGIQFSENAVVEKTKSHRKNLLCLGDSITQGMDARHPSSTYPVQLGHHFGMNVLNHGVGGYYFEKESLDQQLPYQPDLITIAYGTNDWNKWSSLSELKDQCEDYLSTVRELYPTAKTFVMTPIWRVDINEPKAMGSFQEVDKIITEVSNQIDGMHHINGLELVPHLISYFGDERVHPSDEGFLHMALNIAKSIRMQE